MRGCLFIMLILFIIGSVINLFDRDSLQDIEDLDEGFEIIDDAFSDWEEDYTEIEKELNQDDITRGREDELHRSQTYLWNDIVSMEAEIRLNPNITEKEGERLLNYFNKRREKFNKNIDAN